MRNVTGIAIALVLLAGGIVERPGLLAQESPLPATTPVDSVRKFVLPELDAELPPGKGMLTVKTMCGMCHTPHYILNQPPLSREIWTAEITKMQKSFSGPIPQESVPEILEYLMAVRGAGSK